MAEVANISGQVRQYQDKSLLLKRCADRGMALMDVMNAVKPRNLNVSGKIIEEKQIDAVVRGLADWWIPVKGWKISWYPQNNMGC